MDNNNLIEQLLNNISPEESQRIENKMLPAAKIDDRNISCYEIKRNKLHCFLHWQ